MAVLVAHPDDEVLWCGGLLLAHPDWNVLVGSLCRGGDPDRAPKFFEVLDRLGCEGAMADLDDGPGQDPLPEDLAKETLMSLLPECPYDLVITHGPQGEYTRHRRHEEVSSAVAGLRAQGRLRCRELWQFAYEDGGGAYLPRAEDGAAVRFELSEELWRAKAECITGLYGFSPESWEARSVPRTEAFWIVGRPGRVSLEKGKGAP